MRVRRGLSSATQSLITHAKVSNFVGASAQPRAKLYTVLPPALNLHKHVTPQAASKRMIGTATKSSIWTLLLSAAVATGAVAAPAADPNAGKAAFAPCSVCHSVAKGGSGIGPSLAGVVGRKAGSIPGFAYSAAMKAKGPVWSAAALDAFLTSPQKALPGNRMPYPGQPDAGKRAAIIAYLKTVK
jgi:cytochrome c